MRVTQKSSFGIIRVDGNHEIVRYDYSMGYLTPLFWVASSGGHHLVATECKQGRFHLIISWRSWAICPALARHSSLPSSSSILQAQPFLALPISWGSHVTNRDFAGVNRHGPGKSTH